ncbi:ABC transporter permease subunit [Cohnella sp. CFH 77786]|uniref:amino acid ABC transporter permease n=1 Tax=Cohnella sp. CFH 77786 TaxID=2662265 RepID=UPI001C6106BD|nr:amino acid ABC transporter permease [Cohnella sp. CFH 77786]MBW5449032.1 ABC transporter permease subunit [Cohnella sp. CFH 77786]
MTERQWNIALDSLLPLLKAGVAFTIPLALISFVLGLLVAVLTAIIRLYGPKPLALAAQFYVWVIRGTPLLVQLFIIFFGLPRVGIVIDPFPAAIIGFTVSVGAYGSETVRAAILSIHKGQWEASYALGMTRWQALRRTVLPQAARVATPTLASSFISLVKDTSLAFTVTVPEMFQRSQQIVATTYEPLVLYVEVALIYLLICSFLSFGQARLEKHFDRYHTR